MRKGLVVFVGLLLLIAASAFAQTTGALTGTATTDGVALPGVTVTVSSPALQGTRTAVTNENGAYIFPTLPPGQYTVAFELSGMQPIKKKVSITLAQTSRVDAAMGVSAVAEAITVTATAPSTLETTEVSSNFNAQQIENLPVARDIGGTVALAPGVSDEGPGNQAMISGAPSYENLYLVNGAVVNDSIRGQPEAVYIEDAIQESTIITGNVSAEYGRFTGGIISTITKSGGNEFSGSFRDSMTNDDWVETTPYPNEAKHIDNINEIYEATFGGRIVRDRLWFFAAGRSAETALSRTIIGSNIPYTRTDTDDRWEGKLTAQITPKHSIVGSYLDRQVTQANYGYSNFVDTRSLVDRELPYNLMSFNYNGVLSNNFLLEAIYSARNMAFVNSGSLWTDRINGTIIRDDKTSYRGWSPTFCGVCGDKTRDNEYMQVKGTYFLSTASTGTHNLVAGIEDFAEMRNENNEQGGSGYRVWGDFIYVGQDVFFHVEPGLTTIENWPVLARSETSNAATGSFYVNDKWDLNSNFSFNVGLRYDKNDAVDQAGAKVSNDSAFSPRLGVIYDLKGDGRHRFNAGYNQYVSKIDNGINDTASSAGSPAYFGYSYDGPEINAPGTPTSALIPTDQVLQQVFNWFDSVGGDSSSNPFLIGAELPGINTILDGELVSPQMTEYSVGYGAQIGSKGFVRGDVILRDWANFYTATTNMETGQVQDDLGNEFDLTIVGNNDAGLVREYKGFQFQGGYRILDNLNLGGNYTWSELKGNADSETANNATVTIGAVDNYPEYLDRAWNNPERYLTGDVTHRLSLWLAYDLPTPIGAFNFSLLERYHSGYPYYASSTISLAKISNPGYVSPLTTGTYYVSTDDFRTEDTTRTDLGINYQLPIWKVKLFAQADILNLFNESALEDPSYINQTVLNSRNSACKQGTNGPTPGARCLAFNPMTETPVQGIHWQYDPNFGKATSALAYQTALTYRFSFGVRF